MSDPQDLLGKLKADWRFAPVLAAGATFALLLLVYGELTSNLRDRLVPSLAVYLIGAAVIGYMERMADWYRVHRTDGGSKERADIPWFFMASAIAHALWLLALVAYNICYGVLAFAQGGA